MFRRTAPALLALLVGVPGLLSAQYFGRNKVQYTDFDFKVIQTEHFDVYYYDRERPTALVRRGHGGVSLARPDQRRDRHVAPGRVARGKAADHRADDGGPIPVLPLPLRPRALVVHRRALG